MTETEEHTQGQLYAIESLVAQALADRFRCIDDSAKVTETGRMKDEIDSALVEQPLPMRRGAAEAVQRILLKAVKDAVGSFP